MDIYGHGQEIGALVVCYCKKRNIDIDEFVKGMYNDSSIFISGISDGIGGNRNNGKNVNNLHLDFMKIE